MPHTPSKGPNPGKDATPMMLELHKILLKSEKFINWNPYWEESDPAKFPLRLEESRVMKEQHYTPAELAELWGVSVQTIRDLFKSEDGVLKLGSDGTKTRRAYKTLRIPHSVAERVHTRLSA